MRVGDMAVRSLGLALSNKSLAAIIKTDKALEFRFRIGRQGQMPADLAAWINREDDKHDFKHSLER
jgi:hypothetical protein